MKTLYWLMFLVVVQLPVSAQNTSIPDANFEQALIDLGLDSGAIDGQVPTANITGVTDLVISGRGISDLTGIADFDSLDRLICYNNFLDSLDVSQNGFLRILNCGDNQLTYLNLPTTDSLQDLLCYENNLTTLYLNPHTNLQNILCYNNAITEINVSNSPGLNRLDCYNNNLSCLNLKNGVHFSPLIFDATNNPNLTCIEVDSVEWSEIYMSIIDSVASFSTVCMNNCSSVGFGELTSESVDILIWPNPAHGNVSISVNRGAFWVFNMMGQEVYASHQSGQQDHQLSNLQAGVYVVVSLHEGQRSTKLFEVY